MDYETFPVGDYGANCTLLRGDSGKAWIVDPGDDADLILGELEKRRLSPALIVLTHCHFDHVSALDDLLAKYPVPVYIHKDDAELVFCDFNRQFGYKVPSRPADYRTELGDGDVLEAAGISAKIIATPGHTPGGWCLYFATAGLLIAGDTLFAGSVGRTDFPGGSFATLRKSIDKLLALPDDTKVICGHGPETTIGAERRSNPFLQE